VLSRVFRGKFLHGLKRAAARGELRFHGQLAELAEPSQFAQLLATIVRRDWVVYAKRPFGGPRQVLKYLARYTHRVAISDARIVGLTKKDVTFRYKDYADQNQTKQLTLSHVEFIRRLLLHVLPNGFSRVRYYGFLSNRYRQANLRRCRELLGSQRPREDTTARQEGGGNDTLAELELRAQRCPKCQIGRMIVIEEFEPNRPPMPPCPHFRRQLVVTEDDSVTFQIFNSTPTCQDTS
jgi:hypothetical protein